MENLDMSAKLQPLSTTLNNYYGQLYSELSSRDLTTQVDAIVLRQCIREITSIVETAISKQS